jgi:amino acid adenylation domain-containing protein/non-ribosomal peptide synthase protein (TIGR01720 family)
VRIFEESIISESIHTSYSNIVELVSSKVNERANKTAYIFLQDGENESARINFAELDQRARAIAARLQSLRMTGERALLLYPPGFDYIEGFLACLYAGVIAVPAYPPSRRHKSRLFAVINDAKPAIVLTTNDLKKGLIKDFADSEISQQDFNWLTTDNLRKERAESWLKPQLNSDSLAFLQYTSGTTGDPKGVMVSHGNLMANQASIQQGFEHTENSIVAGWLPMYHDMGLIGNLLQPLYLGATAILMPPMAFLEKPIRWLRAISNYKAETSGGPNFAYDLCYQKITLEQMQGLDLSGWTLAFNGSEPVHDKTMERFAEKFSDCGFKLGSFYPCYGLAEATLFVSGKKLQIESGNNCSTDLSMDSEQKQPQFNSVSSGLIPADQQLRIVNPETAELCQDGDVGEIWLAGANITQGYWNRPELSKQMFQAEILEQPQQVGQSLALDNKSYLRTGDLGFVSDEQLYISGRIKDLIIIRGRNFYPQDIERTLTENISNLISDGCVAFSITDDNQQEQLIVAAELTRSAMRKKNYPAIIANMRQVLTEVCEVTPAELILIRLGTVPKTSSGKNRRQACKKIYLQNNLTELFPSGDSQRSSNRSKQMDDIVPSAATLTPEFKMLKQALAVIPPDQRSALISQFLKNKIALMTKLDESEITPELSLPAFGLDSLKVVELKHVVDQLLDRDIPLSLFLSDSSLAEIAQQLSEIIQPSTEHQAEDKFLEKGHAEPENISEAISPNKKDASALSTTQLSMWTMQQLEPDSIIYNLHLALQIQGKVEHKTLHQAFQSLLQRHTQLRTVYRIGDDETVKQQVLEVTEIEEALSVIDASSWSEDQLQDDMAHKAREAFDLSKGPLIRARFYQQNTDDKQNTLLICVHHIVIDLWSVLILIVELKIIYADLITGQTPQLPILTSNYNDFVSWQQAYMQSPNSQKDWAYWQKQLSGELPLLALPTDYQRPTVSDYQGASLAVQLNKGETEQLKNLAKQQGVTLFALLLTAYKVLLHRYTHQKDLIVGVPTSGRSQSSFSSVVGNFVNPLPLRSYPSGDKSFTDYLAEVNESLLTALKHQDYPFSQIVEQLQSERIADHWLVYQTLFVLQQAQGSIDAQLAQLALGENGAPIPWNDRIIQPLSICQRIERFDLKLMAAECKDGLLLSFQYRSDLFKEATVDRLSTHFHNLLLGLLESPIEKIGKLPLIDDIERNTLVDEYNETQQPFGEDVCIHHLFEDQVTRTPNANAVVCKGEYLTYKELNASADNWAHRLVSMGVEMGDKVAICVNRSNNFIVGILAVLKAGAAYVPIDSEYPVERVAHMLDDAEVKVLLTQRDLYKTTQLSVSTRLNMDEEYSKGTGSVSTCPKVLPAQSAYVIYTSGSTGQSKGVCVSHHNLVNYTQSITKKIPSKEGLQYALVSSPAADLGNTVLFASLISGGCLHILDSETTTDGRLIAGYMDCNPIDVLKIVPSHFSALLDSAEGKNIVPHQTLVFGGDVLQYSLVERVASLRPECKIINHYGPTEATIGVLTYLVNTKTDNYRLTAAVPIGRPIANSQTYILDHNLEPVPIGISGELYIAGNGVTEGYLNQPGLTAERFIPNPFGHTEQREENNSSPLIGSRLYRTGDLARYNVDGVVEFLGRADQQFKIRGYRVEPGEIEARLRQHSIVKEAVVIAWEDSQNIKRLVAYIVPNSETPDQETLRIYLQSKLPDYMVPSIFVMLQKMPLMANGKLDRKALPQPDLSSQLAHQYIAPRNEKETNLATVWAEVLRIDQVGIYDNFFSLGGDSILSIQMASRARQLGLNLSPRQIFQHQTVAELALVVENEATFVAEQGVVSGSAPLTPVQKKFLSQGLKNPHHWNQALLLELLEPIDTKKMKCAIEYLIVHHDVLRLRFNLQDESWVGSYKEEESLQVFHSENLTGITDDVLETVLNKRVEFWQQQININTGPMIQVVRFELGQTRGVRLLIVIHHLLMDIASWRILLDDLVFILNQPDSDSRAELPSKTTSYRQWATRLKDYAKTITVSDNLLAGMQESTKIIFPVDYPEGTNIEANAAVHTIELSEQLTRALVQQSGAAYRTSTQELLLIAIVQGIANRTGLQTLPVEIEAHSRDNELFQDFDFTRTIGRFTTSHPVLFNVDFTAETGNLVKAIKEQFRQQAADGFDYAVWRWLGDGVKQENSIEIPILFNYLGHLDLGTDAHSSFRQCDLPAWITRDSTNQRAHELVINASIRNDRLQLIWVYSKARYSVSTIEGLSNTVLSTLETLISQCLEPSSAGLTPSDFPLANLTQENLDSLSYSVRNIEDIYPLGPMQEGMLFYALMYPGSGIYHMLDRYEIDGEVDVDAFQMAWQEVLNRHPILRTSFLWEDYLRPHQFVHKQLELPFSYQDWRDIPEHEHNQRFNELLETELKKGFDFTIAPLMRILLVRLADKRYRFIRSHHHILMDAWCKSPVLLEFRANYEALVKGEIIPFREAVIPYHDYIDWLEKQDRKAAENFWTQYLAGFDEPTPLVVDKPPLGDAKETSEVADLVVLLSEQDTKSLSLLSQRYKLTPNSFLQAAWSLLLAHYSSKNEVLFGVTVAGRPTELPGVETALGLFINSLPLRVKVKPEQTVLELLRSLLYQNLELRQYEYMPLVKIQAMSDLPNAQALFQHLFVFENAPVDPTLRGTKDVLNIIDDKHRTHSNYPINAVLVPGPQFHLQITYDVSRFDADVVKRMIDHFKVLLEAVIRHPEACLDKLPMLTDSESGLICKQWNQTKHSYPEPCDVVALFEAQVELLPDDIAVAFQGEELTYSELNHRVNRITHGLLSEDVGPETLVALFSDRGIEFMVMMLSVFKAGAAYLPVDPSHPDARIAQLIEDSGASMVLVSTAYSERVTKLVNLTEAKQNTSDMSVDGTIVLQTPKTLALKLQLLSHPEVLTLHELEFQGNNLQNPAKRHIQNNLAFVIFTSGSTGKPKGAMVEHQGMFNNLITKVPTLGLTEHDAIAQTAGQCFDISVWQHLTALVCGARVEIFQDEIVKEPNQLLTQLEERGVTILEAVPSMIQALLEIGDDDIKLSKLRWLIACGEAFPPELCRRWMERYPHVKVLNAYGPAECSDDVSYYQVPEKPSKSETIVPIGKPVHNTRLYLLNHWLQPVPIGVPGEICVSGIQVGRGYLGRPDLTAETFIPDPFNKTGERLYRTGDLGRYREGGIIEFLGRIDHQVKIRGVRIEPGEIEAQILVFPKVEHAFVMVREDGTTGKRLVAYVVCDKSKITKDVELIAGLRNHLSVLLPAVMVPSAFVLLDALPFSSNGKIDRKALPEPDMAEQSDKAYVAPRNPAEETLVEIWKEVLDIEQIGVTDNFFELGGHSLLAVQVLSRIRKAFGTDVPLRQLFEASTIESLALKVEEVLIEQLNSMSDEEAEALLNEQETVE